MRTHITKMGIVALRAWTQLKLRLCHKRYMLMKTLCMIAILSLFGCTGTSQEKFNGAIGVTILTPIFLLHVPFIDYAQDDSCYVKVGMPLELINRKFGYANRNEVLEMSKGIKVFSYNEKLEIHNNYIDQYQENRQMGFSCAESDRSLEFFLVFKNDKLLDIYWGKEKERFVGHYKKSSELPYPKAYNK